MPTIAFLTKRKEGEVAQRYCAGMFKSWGLSFAATPRGYHPGYDGILTGVLHGLPIRAKVEIKYDRLAAQTGNLYLDIESLRKSQATILLICLNDPIDKVLLLPLQQALEYAQTNQNGSGGEFSEPSCICPIQTFINDLKPQVLSTKQ